MRCRKARWYLSARCDDTLSERQRQRLSVHLEECAECRREAFYFSEIANASSRLETVSVRPDFNLRLRATIRRAEAESSTVAAGWKSRFPRLVIGSYRPVLVLAASAILLLVGSYQFVQFRNAQSIQADHADESPLGHDGLDGRDAAFGFSRGTSIEPSEWQRVDGLSPEMKRLREVYLADRNLERRYILETDDLNDRLSTRPHPEYIMPVVRSDQVVQPVSY